MTRVHVTARTESVFGGVRLGGRGIPWALRKALRIGVIRRIFSQDPRGRGSSNPELSSGSICEQSRNGAIRPPRFGVEG